MPGRTPGAQRVAAAAEPAGTDDSIFDGISSGEHIALARQMLILHGVSAPSARQRGWTLHVPLLLLGCFLRCDVAKGHDGQHVILRNPCRTLWSACARSYAWEARRCMSRLCCCACCAWAAAVCPRCRRIAAAFSAAASASASACLFAKVALMLAAWHRDGWCQADIIQLQREAECAYPMPRLREAAAASCCRGTLASSKYCIPAMFV